MSLNKRNFQRFSWKEYQSILDKLYLDISRYLRKGNLKIDIVVPIIRGGAIPGTVLAYKLHVLTILPVHYHYDFREPRKMKLRRFISIERYKDLIPKNPTILTVEGNQCFGNTANAALNDIKRNIDNVHTIHAADLVDYGNRNAVKADAVFYGTYTNECGTLTKEEARSKGIFPSTKLLPWEVEKEEKETIEQEQFNYSDLKHYFAKSKVAKEINIKELLGS